MIKTENFSERANSSDIKTIHMFSFQLGVVWVNASQLISVPFSNSLYLKAVVSIPFFDEVRTLNGISLIIDRIDSSRLVRYFSALSTSGRPTHKHRSSYIPRTLDAAGARIHDL